MAPENAPPRVLEVPGTLVEPLMRRTNRYVAPIAAVAMIHLLAVAVYAIRAREWTLVAWACLVMAPLVGVAVQWLFKSPPVADGARRELRVLGQPPIQFDDIVRIYVRGLIVPPVENAALEPSLEAAPRDGGWKYAKLLAPAGSLSSLASPQYEGRWKPSDDGVLASSGAQVEPYGLVIVGSFEPLLVGICHDRYATKHLGRELAALMGKPLCDERGQRLDGGPVAPWWQAAVEPDPAPTYTVARDGRHAEFTVPLRPPLIPLALIRVMLLLGAGALASGLVYLAMNAHDPFLSPATWTCATGLAACLWMFRVVVERATRYVFRVDGVTLSVEGGACPPRLFPLDNIEWIGVHAVLGSTSARPTCVLTIVGNSGNVFQSSDFTEEEARGIAWTLAGLCAPGA